MDTKDYLPLFIEETRDNLQQMSENLLQLERNPGDREVISETFRAIHTIKGMSATMGYADISNLAHQAENVLDLVRQDQAQVSAAMINGFFEVIDEFGTQLSILEQTGEPGSIDAGRVRSILSLFTQPASCNGNGGRYRVVINFGRDCMLPSARAMIICNQLEQVSTLMNTEPPRDQLPTLENLDRLECHIAVSQVEHVKALLNGGIEIESFVIESLDEEQENSKQAEVHSVKNTATIRVDTEKLDHLLNLVSELVINKTSIQQAASIYPILSDGVEHLHRLTGDLQSIVMNMRMIPLDTVFNRFPRMVRDTALGLNKSVSLDIQGADTELDRTIIDDISDPLVHLLRNAIDHGIQPADQRQRLGKSGTGNIKLRAYQTGNQVIIEVSDDGKGLDLDRIRTKARNSGMWSGGEPDSGELTNLIFVPGFSTAENITDLSGRGVGLDVVKKSIESLGGVIEVFSQPNKGTTFRISLPLTLAIIQGLLIRSGTEVYVIPLSYVRETELVYSQDIQIIGHQQIVMLRGQVLPVVFLSKLLMVEDCPIPEELSLVVVRHGEREVGILVDDLIAQQEIVIKNVNWGESFFRFFLGSTILGDGSVVLILDINVILSAIKAREGGANG
jgi:two-component system chemotaxis sensor kinase CheA